MDDRVILAQQLWDSIEGFSDPNIEEEWLEKAEKRWEEIENGRVHCFPAAEAMLKARNSLKSN